MARAYGDTEAAEAVAQVGSEAVAPAWFTVDGVGIGDAPLEAWVATGASPTGIGALVAGALRAGVLLAAA
jgi:hypothetical protein